MQRCFVDVVYKDENLEPTWRKTYTLEEYTTMLKLDIFRQISDIEDMVYVQNDYKPKMNWSDESWSRFNAIRHKMLDKAGDIGRLSETLRVVEKREGDGDGESYI